MPSKDFERTVQFRKCKDHNGSLAWLPLVEIILITSRNTRVTLPLLFDTGATATTLCKDLHPMLGLQSWDEGLEVKAVSSNGLTKAYRYSAELEVFGVPIKSPIHLMDIPSTPLYCGLLGRDTVFDNFGFGFWESTHELFITTNP